MTDTVNMPSGNPSRKVTGAAVGAGAGVVTANLITWGLDDLVFEPDVVNSVPGPVEAFVLFVVPVALTWIGGYLTKRSAAEVLPPT